VRSPRLRLAALAAAPLLLLAGCSTEGDGDAATQSGDDAAVTSVAATGDIADLAVDTEGETPAITLNDQPFAEGELPFRVAATQSQTVAEGDGEEVAADHEVQARYLAVNGTTGEQILSTYDADETVTLDLSNENLFPAFLEELPGRTAGESLLLAIPATDAFGAAGNPQLGVEADDTLVFFLELISSSEALTAATGEPVEPEEGLPEVEADGASAAQITIPDDVEEPAELVVQPLIKGEGATVEPGQTIKVHYTGVKFADGEGFDNSYERGEPAEFPIGVGRVITGWDEGLVGQTVGSRVLLVIPAEQAYGEVPEETEGSTAQPPHPLAGETLVFVVDILGAY
jgi:peptidylprolyl isomerase